MPPLFLAGGPTRFLPRKRLMQVSVLCQRPHALRLSSRPTVPWPGTSFNHIMMMMAHILPQAGLAGRLLGGCASVPPPSHSGWADRSLPSHHRTPCPTGSDRSTRTMAIPHAYPTLLPPGGPAGRPMHMDVPRRPHCFSWEGPPAAYLTCQFYLPAGFREAGPQVAPDAWPYPTLHQPCRPQVGPEADSCPWLYRNAATLSRRRARRPPHARGCTAMPPLFLLGGPAGRLMHVAVPHATTLSRR